MKRPFGELSESWLNAREDKQQRPSRICSTKRRASQYCLRALLERSLGRYSSTPVCSTILGSKIECTTEDVKELLNEDSHCIPFAISSANTCSLTAVADAAGVVRVFDHAYNISKHCDLFQVQAHKNAIFDVRWSEDDKTIATASGDRTVSLIDVQTQTCRGLLRGHSSTVKQAVFDPKNPFLLSTGGRDGIISIWDMRASFTRQSILLDANSEYTSKVISPVASMVAAHGCTSSGTKQRGKATMPPVSVTCLLYKSNGELVSASAGNATLKTWDLRYLPSGDHYPFMPHPLPMLSKKSYSERLAAGKSSLDKVQHSKRDYGVSSLLLSSDGSQILSVNRDSRVYVYAASHASAPPMSVIEVPQLKVKTFFCKAALTRDHSNLLVLGNANGQPVVVDINRAMRARPLISASTSSSSFTSSFGSENQVVPGLEESHDGLRPTVKADKRTSQVPDYAVQLNNGHDLECTGIAMSHDSSCFVSISDDCFARVWRRGDMFSGSARMRFRGLEATGCVTMR